MRSIVVTGINGQLGRCLQSVLSDYHIIGIDLNIPNYEYDTSRMTFIEGDISNPNFWDGFSIDPAFKVWGLVNNAAKAVFSPFETRTVEQLKSVIDVNIIGTILCTKFICEYTDVKRVVSLGSIYAEIAPDFSMYTDTARMSSEIYGMSKAGVVYLMKYLAKYYQNKGINFNSISPGGIDHNQGEDFKSRYSNNTMTGRLANASEIASVVKFLLSEDSSYINAENIFVDGGITKW